MSAIRLQTGSPTRPLTPDELELLAIRLCSAYGHFTQTAKEVEDADESRIYVEPVECLMLSAGSVGAEAVRIWHDLPQWAQDYWIGIARQTVTSIYLALGDRALTIKEDRH